MIKHSPSLQFCILGPESQVGQALVTYFTEREVPFSVINSDDLAGTLDSSDRFNETYFVNALPVECPSGRPLNESLLLSVTEKLAAFCQANDRVLFQLSSASVFDGQKKSAYKESDATHPVTEIGQLLLSCEHKAVQRCASTVILRTSWLFDSEGDNYLTRLCNAAVSETELRVSGVMKACPTGASSVAKAIVAMAEQIDCGSEPDLWGVYHYVDSDVCSMYTFSKAAINGIKALTDVKVETVIEVSAEEGGVEESYELSCLKILSTFGIKQHPWRRGLSECIKKKFTSDPALNEPMGD
ncbi:NAD(P)-dependent oxidoreductase [Reinekea forsetii]|nr:NAD(P)-dependent oxidoreductase [Reinekea forsetii]